MDTGDPEIRIDEKGLTRAIAVIRLFDEKLTIIACVSDTVAVWTLGLC